MRSNSKKQTVVIASVVMGLISIMIMGALKKTLNRIPFFRKFLQLQNLGLDSMKDFLELSELNLRTESPGALLEDSPATRLGDEAQELNPPEPHPEEGHLVVWDGDGSSEYTLFISSEYLGKLRLLGADTIPVLTEEEIPELRESTNWIRKLVLSREDVQVGFVAPPPDTDTKDTEQRAEEGEIMNGEGRKKQKCSYPIPFEKFNCRIRSSHGRVSRHLQYPTGATEKAREREVDAWLVQEGKSYYFCLKEAQETQRNPKKKIYEYQVVLYLEEGKGLVRTIPPFKDFVRIELGCVPPGLCYLTGVRSIGTGFEQFVGWVGERQALRLDGLLQPWEDMDHEEIKNLVFEV